MIAHIFSPSNVGYFMKITNTIYSTLYLRTFLQRITERAYLNTYVYNSKHFRSWYYLGISSRLERHERAHTLSFRESAKNIQATRILCVHIKSILSSFLIFSLSLHAIHGKQQKIHHCMKYRGTKISDYVATTSVLLSQITRRHQRDNRDSSARIRKCLQDSSYIDV